MEYNTPERTKGGERGGSETPGHTDTKAGADPVHAPVSDLFAAAGGGPEPGGAGGGPLQPAAGGHRAGFRPGGGGCLPAGGGQCSRLPGERALVPLCPPGRGGGSAGAGTGREFCRVSGGAAGHHPLPGAPAAGALPLPHRLPELRRLPGLPSGRAGRGAGSSPL